MNKQETAHCRARDFHQIVERLNMKGYEVTSIATIPGKFDDWIYMVATFRGEE